MVSLSISLEDRRTSLVYFRRGMSYLNRVSAVGPWAHFEITSKSLSFLITGDTNVERANIDLSDIPKISP